MKPNADSVRVPSSRLQRGTPIGSSSDAIRAAAQVRQMQKQRTRENFLFGTAAGGAEDVEAAGDETPKAETAPPEKEAAVAPGAATPSEAPKIHARPPEEGATRATCPAPITASASSSSLLSRIVRPRIRLPTMSAATK